jgi:uncharacterized membrane protein
VLIGGGFLYRGMTGRSYVYHALGVTSQPRDKRRASVPYRQGIRVDESVTINAAPSELYALWRRVESLPNFMDRVLSVTPLDDIRSHWVARGPAGKQVQWDAEITNDIPDRLIGWKSLPGSDVDTAGAVHFKTAPGQRGTEVTVELQYLPPGGLPSALLAKLLGEEPEQQVREDLRRLKQLIEAGEVASTTGQPRGPKPRVAVPLRQAPGHAKHSRLEQLPAEGGVM